MTRSTKKGVYVAPKLMKKVLKVKETKSRVPIKTWARSSMIVPEMLNLTFSVHNGNSFVPVFVQESMVGHCLGEFARTRKYTQHSNRG